MRNKAESETEVLYEEKPQRSEVEPARKSRLRTAKEASQLLEELRKAYQSLTPEEQCGVRSFMSDLWKSQHHVTENPVTDGTHSSFGR